MSVGERSKDAVERRLSELEAVYGSFAIHQTTWEVPVEEYEAAVERFDRGHVARVGARVENPDGTSLFVRDRSSDDDWEDPGGDVPSDERMADAVVRRVRETTGVECTVEGLVRATIVGIVDRSADESDPVYRLSALFQARYVDGEPRPGDGIEVVEWLDEPPETVAASQAN